MKIKIISFVVMTLFSAMLYAQIEVHPNNNVVIGPLGGGAPLHRLKVDGHAHINCSPAQWGGFFFQNYTNDGENSASGPYNEAAIIPNVNHNAWLGRDTNCMWRVWSHGLRYTQLGGLSTYSDSTIKRNITPVNSLSALETVLQINAYRYDFKETAFPNTPPELMPKVMANANGHTGFIAQQLKEVFPEAVTTGESNNLMMVDYTKVIPLLVEAVKAQQAEIEELRSLIGE